MSEPIKLDIEDRNYADEYMSAGRASDLIVKSLVRVLGEIGKKDTKFWRNAQKKYNLDPAKSYVIDPVEYVILEKEL